MSEQANAIRKLPTFDSQDLRAHMVPMQYIRGVGPALADRFLKLGIARAFDLVRHIPVDMIHRRPVERLEKSHVGLKITVKYKVTDIEQKRPGSPLTVWGEVGGEVLRLVYFSAHRKSIEQSLPVGSMRTVSGTLVTYGEMYQINHPDGVAPVEDFEHWCGLEPVYPLTAGLTQRKVRDTIRQVLRGLSELPEWIPQEIMQQHKWPSLHDALRQMHAPKTPEIPGADHPARQRLAFDELLADQIMLKRLRQGAFEKVGTIRQSTGQLIDRFLKLLPFDLTPCQQRSFGEIREDLNAPMPMLRLLQGDVGSGKTVVAFLTMLVALENDQQAALLAPTSILAQQHGKTFLEWCDALGINGVLLTGRETKKGREKIYEQLQSGEIQLVVGTHALIQGDVAFKNLGVVVIDEQHRFGVLQRQALVEKGHNPDVLLMTATPIPRTLMLASYGDMACSYLNQKPAGRQDPVTKVMSLKRLDEVVTSMARLLAQGQKIYWVCPLVEESEKLDLAAAEERFANLETLYPGQVGLVHGKMKGPEKDRVMAAFLGGEIKILVATTVIEVGVNDPLATVMIIEQAERYGLAQLHQLRGRIGRGSLEAHCLLLYGYALSDVGRARLEIMKQTTDGFKIAEEDWRLRGGGDILGARQSGLPPYRFADLQDHGDLLRLASQLASKESNFTAPALECLITLHRPELVGLV